MLMAADLSVVESSLKLAADLSVAELVAELVGAAELVAGPDPLDMADMPDPKTQYFLPSQRSPLGVGCLTWLATRTMKTKRSIFIVG